MAHTILKFEHDSKVSPLVLLVLHSDGRFDAFIADPIASTLRYKIAGLEQMVWYTVAKRR